MIQIDDFDDSAEAEEITKPCQAYLQLEVDVARRLRLATIGYVYPARLLNWFR